MKKLFSFMLMICMLFTMLMVPVGAASLECSVDGCTTTNIDITNQYMMDGKLQTGSNLLYNAMPRRIYTNCSAYSSEKNFIKYSTNTGTNGVNSYTYIGDNTTIYNSGKYNTFLELTNGEIDMITDNDLNLEEEIWNRSYSNQYMGLEYDLGGEVALDKFYVCWTNQSTAGFERICRGYELYVSSNLSDLYAEENLVYSVNDNQNGINVITFPENTVGRYFAIRITKCDNGAPSLYVYPRCKEIALSGERLNENYATCYGIPTPVAIGGTSTAYWMNDTDTSDPENIIKGLSPIKTSYTDSNGTSAISDAKFAAFTDGYFNDVYVQGHFQGDTYMNDNTYEDIVWDLGEAKGFWEAWLAFRTEVDGNCFYAVKYQLYAGNDSATIFNSEPIITVDGNAQNMNKISFNKRTARYVGLRVIVPNSSIQYGASNLRVSIMEFSLLGDTKYGVDVAATDENGTPLNITIEGADSKNYIGKTIELKAPSNVIVGENAYVFSGYSVDGEASEGTLDGDYHKLTVEITKNRKVTAIYKQTHLINYNLLIVNGGSSETVTNYKPPEMLFDGQEYSIDSELTLSRDGAEYKLSSWDINGEVIPATDNGKFTFEIKKNTTITAIYTIGGAGEYLAVFVDNCNRQLGIYSIPNNTAVSEIVTEDILAELTSDKIFGYNFVGEWSQSLNEAYNTTVHFKPIYTQDTKTYDVSVNGNVTKAKFDERLNLVAQNDNFSSWSHGDSVISTNANETIYAPGHITLIENDYGAGNEVTDFATLVNTTSWDLTDTNYTATVTANINGIDKENFVGCGVVFTSNAALISSGENWDTKFRIDEDQTIYKELINFPANGCYMITLNNIGIRSIRYARAFVKHVVNGSEVTTYSNQILKITSEGINMPEFKSTNVLSQYSSHPLLPLYGDNAIPYYNAEYAATIVNGTSDGKGAQTDNNPTITPYLVEGSKKCVIIFPGGGYFQRTDVGEGVNVAKAYNDNGISAFVVRYRVGNNSTPANGYNIDAILADGQRAVQFVRYNAKAFGIDPQKIAVCGFSAGGHLSMMVSQNEHEGNVVGDRIGEISSLANATILSYAVTTLKTGTFGSMPPILSGNNSALKAEVCEKYSGELHVTKNTPPTMVWYGEADTAVNPAYNSQKYCDALEAAGVYYEEYSYAGIGHGVGLNAGTGDTAWHARSVVFLNKVLD